MQLFFPQREFRFSLIQIFLSKNEHPGFRRLPIFISCLLTSEGGPHPLCSVNNLKKFLALSCSTQSFKLFVRPDLSDLSVNKLRWYICKFIRLGDPGSFPKVHDLRKVASSYAFFNSMNTEEICSLVGWSSFRTFKRHYLKSIKEVKSALVVLGVKTSGSS